MLIVQYEANVQHVDLHDIEPRKLNLSPFTFFFLNLIRQHQCFWSRWVKMHWKKQKLFWNNPCFLHWLYLFILCKWCQAECTECRTCVFLCVSQVSTFEYVLRETRVAPRRWKINLASGANRTLRIWRTMRATSCGLPSCPGIKGSTVSISHFIFFDLCILSDMDSVTHLQTDWSLTVRQSVRKVCKWMSWFVKGWLFAPPPPHNPPKWASRDSGNHVNTPVKAASPLLDWSNMAFCRTDWRLQQLKLQLWFGALRHSALLKLFAGPTAGWTLVNAPWRLAWPPQILRPSPPPPSLHKNNTPLESSSALPASRSYSYSNNNPDLLYYAAWVAAPLQKKERGKNGERMMEVELITRRHLPVLDVKIRDTVLLPADDKCLLRRG